ncbi:MAG: type II secretion system F family protein [SAR202 cluster bacterium]|nr:type II secretion system F family protein [SAR202 cluster bacterium]|tara:strand:- start:27905 stop:29110 length:1206 start_codon:yes stop_codon:yes gene_type:complete
MDIKYKAYTQNGEKVDGILETESEKTAYTILEKQKLLPYHLEKIENKTYKFSLNITFKVRTQDLITFTKQLSSLLNAGIPLRKALLIQEEQTKSKKLRKTLSKITNDIENGSSFSAAFSYHKSVFPEFYLRLLKVGEATGNIQSTLNQLSNFLSRKRKTSDKIKQALIYPIFSLSVALFAAFILVTYSLPALQDLLSQFGGTIPITTKILIYSSEILSTYSYVFITIIFILISLFLLSTKVQISKMILDKFLLSIPIVSKIILSSNMFFITNTLSTLIKAGVPVIESMKLAEYVLTNSQIRKWLSLVTQKASQGEKLGDAFKAVKGFPTIISDAISISELKGELTETLDGLSSYYEDLTETSVSNTTELIQPIVILGVASVVGFIAVAVIQGIYSTLGAVN